MSISHLTQTSRVLSGQKALIFMFAFSCKCCNQTAGAGPRGSLPLICLVPKGGGGATKPGGAAKPQTSSASVGKKDFCFLDEDYVKRNFNLPPRPLYLDPVRKPLITFPMGGPPAHFNMARKTKINQMILDGYLDGSEAITAPSVFPYATSDKDKKSASAEEEEEIIYILQLPDIESRCPVHNNIIRTPRFIWHSCKKSKKGKDGETKLGGGPLNKPKPWLLSRHTDFDLVSQW